MPPPIILDPGQDSLVGAIQKASTEGALLVLKPGVHFTRPGIEQRIAIGAAGLNAGIANAADAALRPTIRRPANAINLEKSDANFGLYFVPSPPTEAEIKASVWKRHEPKNAPAFDYAVIVCGFVEIDGPIVDCNMNQQGLDPKVPKEQIEHSAMLGFSGEEYKVGKSPGGVERRIYVAFQRVVVRNVRFENGNYADDLWIARGNFHPNIERVVLENIQAKRKVNRRRATISFTGLAKQVTVRNLDVYMVQMENDANWREQPRKTNNFTASQWILSNIGADKLSLSAAGKVYSLDARELKISDVAIFDRAGGIVQASELAVAANQYRLLYRLDKLEFNNVTWNYRASASGAVRGLILRSKFDDPCDVTFINNVFAIASGAFKSGFLIDAERIDKTAKNSITAEFRGCTYPMQAVKASGGTARVARLRERGIHTFTKKNFGGLPVQEACLIAPGAVVTETATVSTVKIP